MNNLLRQLRQWISAHEHVNTSGRSTRQLCLEVAQRIAALVAHAIAIPLLIATIPVAAAYAIHAWAKPKVLRACHAVVEAITSITLQFACAIVLLVIIVALQVLEFARRTVRFVRSTPGRIFNAFVREMDTVEQSAGEVWGTVVNTVVQIWRAVHSRIRSFVRVNIERALHFLALAVLAILCTAVLAVQAAYAACSRVREMVIRGAITVIDTVREAISRLQQKVLSACAALVRRVTGLLRQVCEFGALCKDYIVADARRTQSDLLALWSFITIPIVNALRGVIITSILCAAVMIAVSAMGVMVLWEAGKTALRFGIGLARFLTELTCVAFSAAMTSGREIALQLAQGVMGFLSGGREIGTMLAGVFASVVKELRYEAHFATRETIAATQKAKGLFAALYAALVSLPSQILNDLRREVRHVRADTVQAAESVCARFSRVKSGVYSFVENLAFEAISAATVAVFMAILAAFAALDHVIAFGRRLADQATYPVRVLQSQSAKVAAAYHREKNFVIEDVIQAKDGIRSRVSNMASRAARAVQREAQYAMSDAKQTATSAIVAVSERLSKAFSEVKMAFQREAQYAIADALSKASDVKQAIEREAEYAIADAADEAERLQTHAKNFVMRVTTAIAAIVALMQAGAARAASTAEAIVRQPALALRPILTPTGALTAGLIVTTVALSSLRSSGEFTGAVAPRRQAASRSIPKKQPVFTAPALRRAAGGGLTDIRGVTRTIIKTVQTNFGAGKDGHVLMLENGHPVWKDLTAPRSTGRKPTESTAKTSGGATSRPEGGSRGGGGSQNISVTNTTIISGFTEESGDARYVNIGGDEMTGLLTLQKSGVGLVVTGTMSGTSLTVSSLKDCDTLDTDSNGALSCGTDDGGVGGSGISQNNADARYVNTSGDTMTGALTVNLSSGTVGLRVLQTMSGGSVFATRSLLTSGSLVVNGNARFKSTMTIGGVTYTWPSSDGSNGNVLTTAGNGTLSWAAASGGSGNFGSGNVITLTQNRFVQAQGDTMTGGLLIQSGTVHGTLPAIKAGLLLEIAGTTSGAVVHASAGLRSSGTIIVTGAATFKSSSFRLLDSGFANCTALETVNGVLTCGSDSEGSGGTAFTSTGSLHTLFANRFVEQKGDTMSGGLLIVNGGNGTLPTIEAGILLEIAGTASGRVIRAQNTLASSGSLVVAGISRFKNTVNAATLSGAALTIMRGTNYVLGNLGIGTSTAAETALEIIGVGSGRVLRAQDTLASSGSLVVAGISRFKNTVNATTLSGAALTIMRGTNYILGNLGIGTSTAAETALEIVGIGSGRVLRAQDTLASSGTLVVAGTSRFKSTVQATSFSGGVLSIMNGNSYLLGNLGIGTSTAPDTALEIIGTASGRSLHAQDLLRSSGSLVVRGASVFQSTVRLNGVTYTFPGADGNNGDVLTTAGNGTLTWAAPSGGGNFGSGNVVSLTQNRFVQAQGDTMTGGLLIQTTVTHGALPTIDAGVLLEVAGVMSGTSLTVSSLKNCDTIDTNGNGVLVCGTDNATGTGLSQTSGDLRYVQQQGDTMSGGLLIVNGGNGTLPTIDAGLLLEIAGTASGRVFHAQDALRSSGSLAIEGGAHIDDTTFVVDAATNRVGIGTLTPRAELEVRGTMSGERLVVGTMSGAGLSDCDAADSKLLWDATTQRFSCGTDTGVPEVRSTAETTTDTLTSTDTVLVSVSITPQSANNEIWIVASTQLNSGSNTDDTATITVIRGTTCGTNVLATRLKLISLTAITGVGEGAPSFSITDAPATTSSVTYSLCGKTAANIAHTATNKEITVQEVDTTADLAEIYPSFDLSLEAADVVMLDPAIEAGIRKTERAYEPHMIGVISTKPALRIGSTNGQGTTGFPVALTGRVPVKVTTENGPIVVGDLLTSSSIPGVAMKATRPGPVLGQAMSSFDKVGIGSVLAFIKNGYGGYGDGFALLAGSGGSLESLFTDRRTVIRASAQEDQELLSLDSGDADGTRNVLTVLSRGVDRDNVTLRVTADGSLFSQQAFRSAGTAYAEWFVSSQEDLIPGDLVCLDGVGAGTVRQCTATDSPIGVVSDRPAFVGNSPEADDTELGRILVALIGRTPVHVNTEGGAIHAGDSLTTGSVPGIARRASEKEPSFGIAMEAFDQEGDGTIRALLARRQTPTVAAESESEPASSTGSGSTVHISELIVDGALHVVGDITIEGLATFLGDVSIRGQLTLSNRQAGYASIAKGGTGVLVEFSTPLTTVPVVTASPSSFVSLPWRVQSIDRFSFQIDLPAPATEEILFAWHAVAVDNPLTTRGTALAQVAQEEVPLIAFPVDSKGVPLSSNTVWNACIRNQQMLDTEGNPYSCSRYHTDNTWEHPDLPMSFIWNTTTTPPLLILPPGYVATVVAEEEPAEESAAEEPAAENVTEEPAEEPSEETESAPESETPSEDVPAEETEEESEPAEEPATEDVPADFPATEEAEEEPAAPEPEEATEPAPEQEATPDSPPADAPAESEPAAE